LLAVCLSLLLAVNQLVNHLLVSGGTAKQTSTAAAEWIVAIHEPYRKVTQGSPRGALFYEFLNEKGRKRTRSWKGHTSNNNKGRQCPFPKSISRFSFNLLILRFYGSSSESFDDDDDGEKKAGHLPGRPSFN